MSVIEPIKYPMVYSKAQIGELQSREISFFLWKDREVALGRGMDTRFYDDVDHYKNQDKSIIVIIQGSSVEDGSWAGLRLCEVFDKDFDVGDQVVFESEQLKKILSREVIINPGQCVLFYGVEIEKGVDYGFNEIMRFLIDEVSRIRDMGIILIFVVSRLSMVDKVIRLFDFSYMLQLENKGVVSEYKIKMPNTKREERIVLPIPDLGECSFPECSGCEHKDWCLTTRAVYERSKNVFLMKRSEIGGE